MKRETWTKYCFENGVETYVRGKFTASELRWAEKENGKCLRKEVYKL